MRVTLRLRCDSVILAKPKAPMDKEDSMAERRTKKCNINSNVITMSVLESKHSQRQASQMTRVCNTVLAISGKLLHAFRAAKYDVW